MIYTHNKYTRNALPINLVTGDFGDIFLSQVTEQPSVHHTWWVTKA